MKEEPSSVQEEIYQSPIVEEDIETHEPTKVNITLERVLFDRKKEADPRKEYLRLVAKVQAFVRGFLTRKHLRVSREAQFRQVHKQVKRLSDGKLYHMFLYQSNLRLISPDQPLYSAVIRQATTLGNVFDLQISLKLAKALFTKDLNAMVTHPEENKEAFAVIADCLDIDAREEFIFDFKRAKMLLQDKGQETKTVRFVNTAEATLQRPASMPKPKEDQLLK